MTKYFGAILILLLGLSLASAQTAQKPAVPDVASSATEETNADSPAPGPASEPTVWIHLVGGR